jgi:hypothetical protein
MNKTKIEKFTAEFVENWFWTISYRRSLQPSEENIQNFKTSLISIFVGHFYPPGSVSGSSRPKSMRNRPDPDTDPKHWINHSASDYTPILALQFYGTRGVLFVSVHFCRICTVHCKCTVLWIRIFCRTVLFLVFGDKELGLDPNSALENMSGSV